MDRERGRNGTSSSHHNLIKNAELMRYLSRTVQCGLVQLKEYIENPELLRIDRSLLAFNLIQ